MPRARTKKTEEVKADVGRGLSPEEEAELAKLEKEAEEKVAKSLSAEEEKTSASESAPEETETPSEKEESEPESPEEGEEEFSEEELARFKEKAQKRIKKLARRAKEVDSLRARLAQLEETIQRLTSQQPTFPIGQEVSTGLPWETPTEPREVTEEEYQAEVTRTAQQIVRAELERQRRLDQLKADVEAVEKKYEVLNPDSENFDQELTTSIGKWYRDLVRSNPNLRLSQFVDELMALREKGARQERSKISAEVAKQAAKQAIVPTGVSKKEGDLKEIITSARSIEELEKAEKLLPRA